MKRGAEQLISSKEKKIKIEQIQDVPNEIWQVIFSHLPPPFLNVVRQVSTEWHTLVQKLSQQSIYRYFSYLMNHPDYQTQPLRLFMKEYQRYQKSFFDISMDVVLSILQGNTESIVFETNPNSQKVLYGLSFALGYPLPEKGLSEKYILEIKRWAIVFSAWHGNIQLLEKLLILEGIGQGWLYKNMALESAAESGHAKVIEKLVANGVSVHGYIASPIHVAAQGGHVEAIVQLAALGANINKSNSKGATPVFIAAQNGHIEVIVKLVEHGADVSTAMNDGATPIFIAAQEGHAKVVQFLLEQNVNIQAYISSAKSLSNFAQSRGSVAIIDRMNQLIEKKIQEGNDIEKIPLLPSEIAYIMGHDEIVNMFKTSNEVVTAIESHLDLQSPAMTFVFNAKKDPSSSSSEEGTMEIGKNNQEQSFLSRDYCRQM